MTEVYDNLYVGDQRAMNLISGIAMLYLAQQGEISSASFQQALNEFKEIYPRCSMAGRIREFLEENWVHYLD